MKLILSSIILVLVSCSDNPTKNKNMIIETKGDSSHLTEPTFQNTGFYGSFCGASYPKISENKSIIYKIGELERVKLKKDDLIDYACQRHDICYTLLGDGDKACDQDLLNQLNQITFSKDIEYSQKCEWVKDQINTAFRNYSGAVTIANTKLDNPGKVFHALFTLPFASLHLFKIPSDVKSLIKYSLPTDKESCRGNRQSVLASLNKQNELLPFLIESSIFSIEINDNLVEFGEQKLSYTSKFDGDVIHTMELCDKEGTLAFYLGLKSKKESDRVKSELLDNLEDVMLQKDWLDKVEIKKMIGTIFSNNEINPINFQIYYTAKCHLEKGALLNPSPFFTDKKTPRFLKVGKKYKGYNFYLLKFPVQEIQKCSVLNGFGKHASLYSCIRRAIETTIRSSLVSNEINMYAKD